MTETSLPPIAPTHKKICVNVQSYLGAEDKSHEALRHKLNDKLLQLQTADGHILDIKNWKGDGDYHLYEIEQSIIAKCLGFFFLPVPPINLNGGITPDAKRTIKDRMAQEFFKLSSLIVGKQVQDGYLWTDESRTIQKPVIILDENNSWEPFKKIFDHLVQMGTISTTFESVATLVHTVDDALTAFTGQLAGDGPRPAKPHTNHRGTQTPEELRAEISYYLDNREELPYGTAPEPEHKVCIFCSAGTRDKRLIDITAKLSHDICMRGYEADEPEEGKERWGVISGCGSTGMMNAVCVGAEKAYHTTKGTRGYCAGANTDGILNLEGIPPYFSDLKVTPDIYLRMEHMAKVSTDFVIMPGGMGTVQETLALLMMRHNQKMLDEHADKASALNMKEKPIILVNEWVKDKTGVLKPFWQPLIDIAEKLGVADELIIVNNYQDVIPTLKARKQGKQEPPAPINPDPEALRTQVQREYSTLERMEQKV